MRHTHMISFEDAIGKIDTVLSGRLVDTERIFARDGLDRFLREKLESRFDVPPFHRSVMDGYAILDGDVRDVYRVIDTVAAGSIHSRGLEPGCAIKVMTGAPVPVGTGCVIMLEDTVRSGDRIQIVATNHRQNIAWQGEDIHAGEPLFPVGRLCTIPDISTIISCGITEISVSRRLRVSLLSTGHEIVNHIEEMTPGKIMNSNGPLMSLISKQAGMVVINEEIVPDDAEYLFRTLHRDSHHADIIVFSGGTSAGDYDYVAETISRLDMTIHFRGVAMRPGKPTIFATGENTIVFGLPGPPPAVFTTFHLFVLRALYLLSGAVPVDRTIRLPSAQAIHRSSGTFREFIPAYIDHDGRCVRVFFHRSGIFITPAPAEGFMVIPEGTTEIAKNDDQNFIPFW